MQTHIRVDTMTEAEIKARLAEVDPSLNAQEFRGAQQSSRRKTQGMEPFTYFVIVFAAHLAAGVTHEVLMQQIRAKFSDKKLEVVTASPGEQS